MTLLQNTRTIRVSWNKTVFCLLSPRELCKHVRVSRVITVITGSKQPLLAPVPGLTLPPLYTTTCRKPLHNRVAVAQLLYVWDAPLL